MDGNRRSSILKKPISPSRLQQQQSQLHLVNNSLNDRTYSQYSVLDLDDTGIIKPKVKRRVSFAPDEQIEMVREFHKEGHAGSLGIIGGNKNRHGTISNDADNSFAAIDRMVSQSMMGDSQFMNNSTTMSSYALGRNPATRVISNNGYSGHGESPASDGSDMELVDNDTIISNRINHNYSMLNNSKELNYFDDNNMTMNISAQGGSFSNNFRRPHMIANHSVNNMSDIFNYNNKENSLLNRTLDMDYNQLITNQTILNDKFGNDEESENENDKTGFTSLLPPSHHEFTMTTTSGTPFPALSNYSQGILDKNNSSASFLSIDGPTSDIKQYTNDNSDSNMELTTLYKTAIPYQKDQYMFGQDKISNTEIEDSSVMDMTYTKLHFQNIDAVTKNNTFLNKSITETQPDLHNNNNNNPQETELRGKDPGPLKLVRTSSQDRFSLAKKGNESFITNNVKGTKSNEFGDMQNDNLFLLLNETNFLDNENQSYKSFLSDSTEGNGFPDNSTMMMTARTKILSQYTPTKQENLKDYLDKRIFKTPVREKWNDPGKKIIKQKQVTPVSIHQSLKKIAKQNLSINTNVGHNPATSILMQATPRFNNLSSSNKELSLIDHDGVDDDVTQMTVIRKTPNSIKRNTTIQATPITKLNSVLEQHYVTILSTLPSSSISSWSSISDIDRIESENLDRQLEKINQTANYVINVNTVDSLSETITSYTIENFLNDIQVRFLDKFSVARRTTLIGKRAHGASTVTLNSAEPSFDNCLNLSCTSIMLKELALYNIACDQLTGTTDELSVYTEKLCSMLNYSQPKIIKTMGSACSHLNKVGFGTLSFHKNSRPGEALLHDIEKDEQAVLLFSQVKDNITQFFRTLKQHCRLQARIIWCQVRSQLENAITTIVSQSHTDISLDMEIINQVPIDHLVNVTNKMNHDYKNLSTYHTQLTALIKDKTLVPQLNKLYLHANDQGKYIMKIETETGEIQSSLDISKNKHAEKATLLQLKRDTLRKKNDHFAHIKKINETSSTVKHQDIEMLQNKLETLSGLLSWNSKFISDNQLAFYFLENRYSLIVYLGEAEKESSKEIINIEFNGLADPLPELEVLIQSSGADLINFHYKSSDSLQHLLETISYSISSSYMVYQELCDLSEFYQTEVIIKDTSSECIPCCLEMRLTIINPTTCLKSCILFKNISMMTLSTPCLEYTIETPVSDDLRYSINKTIDSIQSRRNRFTKIFSALSSLLS